MDNYTRVNLMELDDSMAGQAEGIEGRFGRGPMGAQDVGVSHWRYAPGFRAKMGHRHREQEEAYLVISGSGEMLLDGNVIELGRWDLVRVAPRTVRAFAAGPDGMEVIAVGGPKPEGGDGEPGEVTWPDT
jgi:mannose-6-phosphate isomerase-like protein (cupin superfamily)